MDIVSESLSEFFGKKTAALGRIAKALEELDNAIVDLPEEWREDLLKVLIHSLQSKPEREKREDQQYGQQDSQDQQVREEVVPTGRNGTGTNVPPGSHSNIASGSLPGVTEAIRRLLTESHSGLLASEVISRLEGKFFTSSNDPDGVVYSTLVALTKKGKLTKDGQGYYFLM